MTMAKKKPMDKLAWEAAQALACHMSYGKWKAMQPIVPVQPRKIPDGWRLCEHCGKAFPPKQGQRFCDLTCRNKAYESKAKEMQKAWYRKNKERKAQA